MLAAGLIIAVPGAAAQSLDDAIKLHRAGDYGAALDAYRAAAAAAEASDPASAALARNNACALLMGLGDFDAALVECMEARRLLGNLDDADRLRSRNLNNLGVVQQYLGNYEEAAEHFGEALELNRRRGDVEAEVINLGNLGGVAVAQGRYARAFDAHLEAESLAGEHAAEPWAGEQIRVARINRGVVLERLGEYRRALQLYRDVFAEGDTVGPRRRAALGVNMGVIYRNLGDPIRAVEAFEEAIDSYGELGDAAGLSNAYLNLALARHLNLAQPEAAEVAYRRALQLARRSGDRTEEIQDLFYLGRLLAEMDRTDEAEGTFRSALEAAEQSGSAEGRWSALAGLGKLQAVTGDLQAALASFERAMADIDQARADLARSSVRSGFFGDKRPIFGAAVEVLGRLQASDPEADYAIRAFDVVQRAKARDLLDALGAEGRPTQPRAVETLQERLGTTTMLEYFVAEESLFLWIVRADTLEMVNLGPADPLLVLVAEVHDALSHAREPDAPTLQKLSQVLLAAARPELDQASGLRIAADGRLHYLPFELLPYPDAPGEAVLDRLPVSYLPSGSTLTWLDGSRRPDAPAVLGFSSPSMPSDPSRLPAPARLLASRFDLGPLPEAEHELASARRWLRGPGEVLSGEQATEEAFRSAVSEGARVVHVAAHAIVDERPGQGAAILLTPAGSDDGLLYTREIAGLEIHAGLTVLAACSTALGSPEDGLALASLTGAFLAAGSPAVLATLWDVSDAASAAFMEQFYFELGRGLAPSEAIRNAKLRMRDDPVWGQPGRWAAYVLVGE